MIEFRCLKAVTVLLLIPRLSCWGTTIAVVIAKDGIVIASDSKEGLLKLGYNFKDAPTQVNKVVVLNDKVAVAIVGLADIRTADASFKFKSSVFLNEVRESMTPDTSFTGAEQLVTARLTSMKAELAKHLRIGNSTGKREIPDLKYIFIGYESGLPRIDEISLTVNLASRVVTGPTTKSAYAGSDIAAGLHFQVFGMNKAYFTALMAPSSKEGKAVIERHHDVARAFYDNANNIIPNSAEGILIASDTIRLEIEFEKESVGLPINVITLSLHHAPNIKKLLQ